MDWNVKMDLVCGSLELFAAAIIGVLLICALLRKNHPKPFGNKIIAMLLGHMLGLLSDSVLWFWEPAFFPGISISTAIAVQKVALFLSYSALACMIVIYTYCLVKFIEEQARVSKWIIPCVTALCAVAVIFWTFSLYNGAFFTFDAQGAFVGAKHYWVSQGIIMLLLCVDMAFILKHYSVLGWRKAVPLMSYIFLPIMGFFLAFWWDVTPVYIAATLSLLLMFIVFHLEQDKQLQEQEQQLAQGRISIMLSQIQPHFLYNSLSAIHRLCAVNPKQAQRAIAEFSEYLRGNLESLNYGTPVPFERELRHIEIYLSLEKMRFGDDLTIIYNIETMNFMLPTLTVQPLIENAVKHGICKARDGGCVKFATREREDCYEIAISDDGVGFDPGATSEDGRIHIGIENVRQRLWSVSHGTLEIRSEKGVGTTAAIRLPKECEL